MMSRRPPKRGTIEFAGLVAASPPIALLDSDLRSRGYERSSARTHKRRDGTFTVRCVWRHRGEVASAVTFSLQGVPLR
jgi:hypothetical protein